MTHALVYGFRESAIPIMNEKAVRVIAGYGFSELLHGPLKRGMRRHIDASVSCLPRLNLTLLI
jgi:hypothetical protein